MQLEALGLVLNFASQGFAQGCDRGRALPPTCPTLGISKPYNHTLSVIHVSVKQQLSVSARATPDASSRECLTGVQHQ